MSTKTAIPVCCPGAAPSPNAAPANRGTLLPAGAAPNADQTNRGTLLPAGAAPNADQTNLGTLPLLGAAPNADQTNLGTLPLLGAAPNADQTNRGTLPLLGAAPSANTARGAIPTRGGACINKLLVKKCIEPNRSTEDTWRKSSPAYNHNQSATLTPNPTPAKRA
jgi:hypothetical protein